jgi:hypothetical protein
LVGKSRHEVAPACSIYRGDAQAIGRRRFLLILRFSSVLTVLLANRRLEMSAKIA